jgi:hypothetical protein
MTISAVRTNLEFAGFSAGQLPARARLVPSSAPLTHFPSNRDLVAEKTLGFGPLCTQAQNPSLVCIAADAPFAQTDKWRRERDSNPRSPLGLSGFQDRLFQPLTHLSCISRLTKIAFQKTGTPQTTSCECEAHAIPRFNDVQNGPIPHGNLYPIGNTPIVRDVLLRSDCS